MMYSKMPLITISLSCVIGTVKSPVTDHPQ